MAASGLRVLAMAYGPALDDLTFAGVVGMEDPPREGVPEIVRKLRRGGVKVMEGGFEGDGRGHCEEVWDGPLVSELVLLCASLSVFFVAVGGHAVATTGRRI